MVLCSAACGKAILATGCAKCTQCCAVYHKICAGLSHTARVPATWVCPECITRTPPLNDMAARNSEHGDEGAPLTTEQLDVAEQLRLLRAEFRSVRDEIKGLRRETAVLQQFVGAFAERMEGVEERVKRLEERFEELPTSIADSELAVTVAALKLELNDRDQDLLLNDLEITGIPEHQNENPSHLVSLVGQKLGVNLEERDVVFAERVGARPQASPFVDVQSSPGGAAATAGAANVRPRPLVIRLARRGPRAELLRAARVRRGADTSSFGLPGRPSQFYVNERLTRTNRLLFYRARQECKRLNWKFCWSKDGRVYVRQHKEATARRIHSEADIGKFFANAAV